MQGYEHIEIVRAPIAHCFATITDFRRYPEWFARILDARVESEAPDQGRWRVRYRLDAVLKSIHYTLQYEAHAPEALDWRMVEGDLAGIEGSYRFTELEAGLTEARCRQSVDVGVWVPGPVRRIFETSALSESVGEFKKAAEATRPA